MKKFFVGALVGYSFAELCWYILTERHPEVKEAIRNAFEKDIAVFKS